MTKRQVLFVLQSAITDAGSLRAWCRAAEYEAWDPKTKRMERRGFSASYVSDVLNGKVEPSQNLLRYIGFEAVKQVRYRRLVETTTAEAA
jgi:hypothetical protein